MNAKILRSCVRLRQLFGLGLGLWLFALAFPEALRGDDLPPNYYHDFRGQPLPASLTLFQVKGDKLVQFEPQGLRITFPKTYVHPLGGVGVSTIALIRGDFEVTATVEVLNVEPPRGGPGAGVGLSVDAATKQEQLRRVIGPRGKHSIVCTGYSQSQKDKGPDWKHYESALCADNVLRMRLRRTGTTLHFLWAPGAAGDDFEAIHEKEFGNDDIEHVRLFAMNGRQPCSVDVRLIDLRILSGGQAAALPLPAEKTDKVEKSEKTEAKGWLVAGLIVGLAFILLLALGTWLVIGLRRRGDTMQPEAVSGSGFSACSACGKKLKVKPELAGKKIRCPHCGKTVLVEAVE